jgi:hypothetical protein
MGSMQAPKRVPLLVQGGVGGGLLAGLAAGAVVGPAVAGMLVGAALGAVVGAVAGLAIHREDERRLARHAELDEIIGVSGGDLGAPPGSIPPGPLDDERPGEWGAEWLTPPPPRSA